MKKTRLLALASALALSAGLLSGCAPAAQTPPPSTPAASATPAPYDAAQFVKWFEEEGTWRTIQNDNPAKTQPGGFVTDASGCPSDTDLKEMLHMASLAVTSGGKSDWYMVAVTDPAEQTAIIGDKYGVATSEGTVTVLIFSERIIRDELRTDDTNAFAPDRGYYDAGIVTGYLNIAAIAKGYGSHMFMSPALEGVNGFNNGERGLDCAKYLEGTNYYMASSHESYSTENMKFVCAVVIGTLDESVETGVTDKEFPDNWSIYGAK